MIVRVKLFAVARELAARPEVAVEVDDRAKVADVRRALLAAVPQLQSIVAHVRWAVDAEFVADDTPVSDESDVAVIPPVSGG